MRRRCGLLDVALALLNRIEHDHGDFPPRNFLLIVVVGWPEFKRLLPQSFSFLTGGGARLGMEFFGADLNLDIRIGDQVTIPARMLRRAAFRRDDDVAIAGTAVKQGEDE